MASELEDDHADDGDEDATEAAEHASQTPTPGVRVVPRRPLPTPPALYRYVFLTVWLFAAPAALALLAVKVLEPDRNDFDAGALRTFVGEQQVPSAILLFTLFAMAIWRTRHVLPLAVATGMVLRKDVPTRSRARFEQAASLLEEARRILEETRKQKRRPSAEDRAEVEAALAKLEDSMLVLDFDEDGFLKAHEAAHDVVVERLDRWRKSELREYIESIGFAVAVALVLRFFVIEAFKIPTGSMIPTLMVGDHIFVAKYAYGPLLPRSDSRLYSNLPPRRGDVMVFKFPENKAQDFIKRTVALPGDMLEVLDGRPILNGLLLPHCYVGKLEASLGVRGHLYVEYSGDAAYLTMFNEKSDDTRCEQDLDCAGGKQCRSHACGLTQGPYRVMPGEVWVLGDNRDNSHDSRAWNGGIGAGVPFENIKGRAMFVWWAWDPHAGLGWDRLGVNVMGAPKLPRGAEALAPKLEACLKSRPPLAETTPPSSR
ncbi:MAG: signal peptidase I [Deltaproteobacteria bacterium]|nr:signal peptidase I [Deltaproteobacteria bacterium]